MLFKPQRYKILDENRVPFIDVDELRSLLCVSPSEDEAREVIARSRNRERLSLEQTAVLLRAPVEFRHEVLEAARELKREIYGDRIVLFAPLYVGNLCSNLCDYCSFAADNSTAIRKTLSDQELKSEVEALVGQGHRRLVLVYGEHMRYSASFIADNVREVYGGGGIRRVNINAAPLGVSGFSEVAAAGIGTYQIFQESYNPEVYAQHHRGGMKADYDWRLTAFDRAMEGGIDDVGLGVLFGLNPRWEEEVLALVRHTNHLEACYGVGPHTISVPRITPAQGAIPSPSTISDEDFIYIIAVLRLAVPYAGLILTARESAELRDVAIEYGVSQIDGGTSIEIGGYSEKSSTGDPQFSITDDRSLSEIITELVRGDRIPSFCTACYRKGRTGEHFMQFSTEGYIKNFCTPNAILTFAEYLEDYAPQHLRAMGWRLIERELAKIDSKKTVEKLDHIKGGRRDLYF